MSLNACIITYDDYPLIRDCIESIYDKVDRIIAVDGRYIDFSDVCGDYSTDGTLEYLKSIDKVKLFYSVSNEVDKRNLYLMQAKDNDLILNIDTDEVLVGDIKEIDYNFGIIDLHDGHSKHIQKRATRFFRYKQGMRYQYCHYTLYYQNELINTLQKVVNNNFSYKYVNDFYLVHNWHLRSDERKFLKEKYYNKLRVREAKYRK